jgi:hypothetical protein
VSRSLPNPNPFHFVPQPLVSNGLLVSSSRASTRPATSAITALNIEFVAKPNEAHKVQAALPAAINGALGEVGGFAGSFVMVANHEARLVTVVTLWNGEDRLQRCGENLRWLRALLAPYLDHCLRVQTLAAYIPGTPHSSQAFEEPCSDSALETELSERESLCVA